jgi:DNA invertase Pin-like site-specific DNA recombinase
MALVGYARVSTREERQVLDRQIDALTSAGCEKIFDDRLSGVQADRPGPIACLDYLRAGDVLTVLDFDRLGRRARDLIGMIEDLEKKGVAFKALNSPMDTTTPAGRAFLQIQAAFAEMERNLIRQRVNEGIIAARARGRQGGRPRVMTPERLRFAQHLMADKAKTIPQICRELGDIPSSTL